MKVFAVLALISTVWSQRPENTTICDYYTTALFKENTEANQLALIQTLVHTVIAGNLTATPTGQSVPGILAPATFKGEAINLAPLFTGAAATTNVNGVASIVNFLDDGGAAPFKLSPPMPSNTQTSRQFILVTHLYQIFGALLGCSKQGGAILSNYEGRSSMTETHKFMKLTTNQITFFNTQVGAAASAYGVTDKDVGAVAAALEGLFNNNCTTSQKITPTASGAQGICSSGMCNTCPAGNGPPMTTSAPAATSTPKSSAEGAFPSMVLVTFALISVL